MSAPREEPADDPQAVAERAARRLAALSGVRRVDLAVVLGSGWSAALDGLGVTGDGVAMADLPGFEVPGAAGHRGQVHLLRRGGRTVLVLAGRTHYYEHRDAAAVAHGARTAAAAGARAVILTNAAGSVRPEWRPGTPVLISDHLNLTGASPLSGPRFVDLTDAYSLGLRELARRIRPELPEGVYAQFPGPQYETPAEVRMAGLLGADLVGMSTVLEAIAARAAGLAVLGISLVTNPAAGVSGAALEHGEVLAAGAAAGPELGALLAGILDAWPPDPDPAA